MRQNLNITPGLSLHILIERRHSIGAGTVVDSFNLGFIEALLHWKVM